MKCTYVKTAVASAALAALLLAPGLANADDDDNRLRFAADLSGAQEVPEVLTSTTGRVKVSFNSELSEARFDLRVRDGFNVTQAHLHCGRAGANGPVVLFLFGLVPGGVEVNGRLVRGNLTNADFTGANCVPGIARPVNNIASLALAMRDGLVYANVHTVANPPGEVRGQLLDR